MLPKYARIQLHTNSNIKVTCYTKLIIGMNKNVFKVDSKLTVSLRPLLLSTSSLHRCLHSNTVSWPTAYIQFLMVSFELLAYLTLIWSRSCLASRLIWAICLSQLTIQTWAVSKHLMVKLVAHLQVFAYQMLTLHWLESELFGIQINTITTWAICL